MKNDSLSASSIIKELIDMHKSGTLSDQEYYNLLKSHIINHCKGQHLNQLETGKKPLKDSNEYNDASPRKHKNKEYNPLKSKIIIRDEVQPIKEKVEKVLWILLN